MSYPDPNRSATEIKLETPRWVKWLKFHAGFLILSAMTVILYYFFENRITLAWWGVVLAYLVFVVLAIMGAKFLHRCDKDMSKSMEHEDFRPEP